MQKDIESRSDVELLVTRFYEKVRQDPILGHIFNEVARVNWEKHLPVMFDFWESTLLFTATYKGNPMEAHLKLHRLFPLGAGHFSRWLELFTATVDELFTGHHAALAKQRATSISLIMQNRLNGDSRWS